MQHVPMTPPSRPLPVVQLLVTACSILPEPAGQLAWLHGFTLMNLCPGGTPVEHGSRTMISTSETDDRRLIESLTRLLDPQAQLAGLDLTGMIARLSRLPIDADDQQPALALLERLEAMIRARPPIDLALSPTARASVARHAGQAQSGIAERFGEDTFRALSQPIQCSDPAMLALTLKEVAHACTRTLTQKAERGRDK